MEVVTRKISLILKFIQVPSNAGFKLHIFFYSILGLVYKIIIQSVLISKSGGLSQSQKKKGQLS